MKPQYSPIAPVQLLEKMFFKDILGDYLLLLAHDVLANADAYMNLAAAMRRQSMDTFIIMDNSVVELGWAMPFSEVVAAADIVGAGCVMTPDVLGDYSGTRTVVLEALSNLLDCNYPLMRVPQGSTHEELERCVDWLRGKVPHDGFHPEYWGIPRWVANRLGTRSDVIVYINRTCTDVPMIHLLGMSENFEDDMYCMTLPNVMGIDSANPIVAGFLAEIIGVAPYGHWERGDLWEHKELTEEVIKNVEYMHARVGT